MPVDFGGVPLSLDTPEVRDWLGRWLPAERIPYFDPLPAAHSWGHLDPHPNWRPEVRIGRLHWPAGVRRYATAAFLATSAEVDALRDRSAFGSPYYTLTIDDGAGGKVTPSMWLLPAVPLSQVFAESDYDSTKDKDLQQGGPFSTLFQGGGKTTEPNANPLHLGNLWLLLFVDVRYWFGQYPYPSPLAGTDFGDATNPGRDLSYAGFYSNWLDPALSATIAGRTLYFSHDAIDPAYLKVQALPDNPPGGRLRLFMQQPVAVTFDATLRASGQVGAVRVCHDATAPANEPDIYTFTAANALAKSENTWSKYKDRAEAGGRYRLARFDAAKPWDSFDLPVSLPLEWHVRFPVKLAGVAVATWYTLRLHFGPDDNQGAAPSFRHVDQPAELDPAVVNKPGVGVQRLVGEPYAAVAHPGLQVADNDADLLAYARLLVQDWIRTRLASTQAAFAGILPVQLSPLEDVEWLWQADAQGGARAVTRITRGPLDDRSAGDINWPATAPNTFLQPQGHGPSSAANNTATEPPLVGLVELTESHPAFANLAGHTVAFSPIVTGVYTVGLAKGMPISGAGIPAGATIASVDSASQITLSANATATGATTLTASPNLYRGWVQFLRHPQDDLVYHADCYVWDQYQESPADINSTTDRARFGVAVYLNRHADGKPIYCRPSQQFANPTLSGLISAYDQTLNGRKTWKEGALVNADRLDGSGIDPRDSSIVFGVKATSQPITNPGGSLAPIDRFLDYALAVRSSAATGAPYGTDEVHAALLVAHNGIQVYRGATFVLNSDLFSLTVDGLPGYTGVGGGGDTFQHGWCVGPGQPPPASAGGTINPTGASPGAVVIPPTVSPGGNPVRSIRVRLWGGGGGGGGGGVVGGSGGGAGGGGGYVVSTFPVVPGNSLSWTRGDGGLGGTGGAAGTNGAAGTVSTVSYGGVLVAQAAGGSGGTFGGAAGAGGGGSGDTIVPGGNGGDGAFGGGGGGGCGTGGANGANAVGNVGGAGGAGSIGGLGGGGDGGNGGNTGLPGAVGGKAGGGGGGGGAGAAGGNGARGDVMIDLLSS